MGGRGPASCALFACVAAHAIGDLALGLPTAPTAAAVPAARGLADSPVLLALSARPPVLTEDGESLQLTWGAGFVPAAGDSVLMSCGVRAHPLDCLGKGGNLTVNATATGVSARVESNPRDSLIYRNVSVTVTDCVWL